MKKITILFLTIFLNVNLSFSQTESKNNFLTKGESVNIRIKTNKSVYQIGDTIHLKIIYNNKTNNELLIAFREGSFHFKQLKIIRNEEKLKSIGICREKIAPLGFWKTDYHRLDSRKSLEFELNLEVINFPTKRNCFEEEFYKSGYGIISENYGKLLKNTGEIMITLEYNVQFPSSEKESIHSAYHKKNNVWNEKLISNTINIKIKE